MSFRFLLGMIYILIVVSNYDIYIFARHHIHSNSGLIILLRFLFVTIYHILIVEPIFFFFDSWRKNDPKNSHKKDLTPGIGTDRPEQTV